MQGNARHWLLKHGGTLFVFLWMLATCGIIHADIIDTFDSPNWLDPALNATASSSNGQATLIRTASGDCVINWHSSSYIELCSANDRLELDPVQSVQNGSFAVYILYFDSSAQYINEKCLVSPTSSTSSVVIPSLSQFAIDNNIDNAVYYWLRLRILDSPGDGFIFDELRILEGPGYWKQSVLMQNAPKSVFAHMMTPFRSKDISGQWGGWNHANSQVSHDPDQTDPQGRPDIASVYFPSVGAYDMTNPALVEYQCQLAKMAGVDGLIFDVGFYELDWENVAMIQDYLEIMADYDLQAIACIEDKAQWLYRVPALTSRTLCVENTLSDMEAWLQLFDSSQYKVDTRPVMMLFSYEQTTTNTGTSALLPSELSNWLDSFSSTQRPILLRQWFKMPDHGGILNGPYDWVGILSPPPADSPDPDLVGYSDYDDTRDHLSDQRAYGQYLLRDEHSDFHVSGVWPGFNDRAVWGWGDGPRLVPRLDGDIYELNWNWAIEDDLPLVQIATFNDWFEGSNIEPSVEFGTTYLQKTRTNIAQFKAQPSPAQVNFNVPIWIYKIRSITDDANALADMDQASTLIKNGQFDQALTLVQDWATYFDVDSVTYWLGSGSIQTASKIEYLHETLIADFETNGSPAALYTWGYTGNAAQLTGGQYDVTFGLVPPATQGSKVHGLTWTDPGNDNTVEVGCTFQVPPGYDVSANSAFLLDVFITSNTSTNLDLGIWVSDLSTWLPEGNGIGTNNQWVTLRVDCSGLSGTRLQALNLGFKNVGASGTVFFDNLRMEKTDTTTDTQIFGSMPVGQPVVVPVSIINTGTRQLTFEGSTPISITTGSSDFSIIGTPDVNALNIGERREFTVQFSPSTTGPREGKLSIITNDPLQQTLDIILKGDGV